MPCFLPDHRTALTRRHKTIFQCRFVDVAEKCVPTRNHERIGILRTGFVSVVDGRVKHTRHDYSVCVVFVVVVVVVLPCVISFIVLPTLSSSSWTVLVPGGGGVCVLLFLFRPQSRRGSSSHNIDDRKYARMDKGKAFISANWTC